jgi:mRNA interferase HigB
MRVIAISLLREFWVKHPDSEQPLKAWYSEAQSASWHNPHEIKNQYRTASILRDGRVVFNISGNKYRLVVAVLYQSQVVLIKFIGDHATYDKIDANTVTHQRRG